MMPRLHLLERLNPIIQGPHISNNLFSLPLYIFLSAQQNVCNASLMTVIVSFHVQDEEHGINLFLMRNQFFAHYSQQAEPQLL
jgi:hypothetical protein